MPDHDFDEAIDGIRRELRRELSGALSTRDAQCSERGEMLARHDEHLRAINGNLARIDDSLRAIDAKLDDLCEQFQGWKGRSAPLLSAASAFIGAVVAAVIAFVKTHMTGGTP